MLTTIMFLLLTQIGGVRDEIISESRGLGALRKLRSAEVSEELRLSPAQLASLKSLSDSIELWELKLRSKDRASKLPAEEARIEHQLNQILTSDVFSNFSRWVVRTRYQTKEENFGLNLLGIPEVKLYLGGNAPQVLENVVVNQPEFFFTKAKLRYEALDELTDEWPEEKKMRLSALLGRPIKLEFDIFGLRTVPLKQQVAFASTQTQIKLPPLPQPGLGSGSLHVLLSLDPFFPDFEKIREPLENLRSEFSAELSEEMKTPGFAKRSQDDLKKFGAAQDKRAAQLLRQLLNEEQLQLLSQKSFKFKLFDSFRTFLTDKKVREYLGDEPLITNQMLLQADAKEKAIADKITEARVVEFNRLVEKLNPQARERLSKLIALPDL